MQANNTHFTKNKKKRKEKEKEGMVENEGVCAP